MLYLTENPHDISRHYLIYTVNDPPAEKLLWTNYLKYQNLQQLNQILTRSLQKLNPGYEPREAHNYAKIRTYSRESCNQIVGFNTIIYDYEHFKHQPLYLIRGDK